MSKLTLALVAIILGTVTTIGQTNGEYTKLRDWLHVSPATIIVSSSTSKLPARAPLKIYVATGKDERARSYYAKWVAEWNRGAGKQFGLLEIVPDLTQANLIIARLKGDTTVEQRGTIGTVPAIDTRITGSRPTVVNIAQVYKPLFAYLLLRTPDGLELVYRHVDRSTDGSDPDGKLVKELKKKIKQR